MGQKPSKIDFLAKWSPFFSLQVGPESTDFRFFGLVGFVKVKSQFPEIFRSPGQFWPALELSEPKSPKMGSPRDINTNVWIMSTSQISLEIILTFLGTIGMPEKIGGVPCDKKYMMPPTVERLSPVN